MSHHPAEADEPFGPLDAWMSVAWDAEPRVPDAVQLATVDDDGRPTLRTVLLKGWGADGLVFYTNLGSRKARHLTQRPGVALLLHWKSLERQVIVEGEAELLSDSEADAYHATRARESQLGAWASKQSALLPDRAALEARLDEARQRFEGQPVPRPPFWGGYRVHADRVEFWQGLPGRLHARTVFEKSAVGWRRALLYP